jgi:hypothetical protein
VTTVNNALDPISTLDQIRISTLDIARDAGIEIPTPRHLDSIGNCAALTMDTLIRLIAFHCLSDTFHCYLTYDPDYFRGADRSAERPHAVRPRLENASDLGWQLHLCSDLAAITCAVQKLMLLAAVVHFQIKLEESSTTSKAHPEPAQTSAQFDRILSASNLLPIKDSCESSAQEGSASQVGCGVCHAPAKEAAAVEDEAQADAQDTKEDASRTATVQLCGINGCVLERRHGGLCVGEVLGKRRRTPGTSAREEAAAGRDAGAAEAVPTVDASKVGGSANTSCEEVPAAGEVPVSPGLATNSASKSPMPPPGRFSAAEDEAILRGVHVFGEGSWAKIIASEPILDRRSSDQIRARYRTKEMQKTKQKMKQTTKHAAPPKSPQHPAVHDAVSVVGKRVRVYWSGDKRWYHGKVQEFDEQFQDMTIVYDDGDIGSVGIDGRDQPWEYEPTGDSRETSSTVADVDETGVEDKEADGVGESTGVQRSRRNYTTEEDAIIVRGVKEGLSWDQVTASLPGRLTKGVRKHYYSVLRDHLQEPPASEPPASEPPTSKIAKNEVSTPHQRVSSPASVCTAVCRSRTPHQITYCGL